MRLALTFLILTLPCLCHGEALTLTTIQKEALSPWTKPARYWLLGGTGAVLTLLALDDQIDEPTQKEFVEERPIGRFSKLGDYGGRTYPNLIYIGGMLGSYWLGHNPNSLRRAEVMFKASAYAILASTILKVTIREPRPIPTKNNFSFPSGHTTAAFAFSSVVVAEHGFFPYGILALGLSTLTALSRINDNQHFLHDVVGGAALGTAYGLGIYYLYREPKENNKNSNFSWMITPKVGSNNGLQFVGVF